MNNKQIKEIAGIICESEGVPHEIVKCDECKFNNLCDRQYAAKTILNAGYRKQKETEWVEEYSGSNNILCKNCSSLWNVLDNCTENFVFCPKCGCKIIYKELQNNGIMK